MSLKRKQPRQRNKEETKSREATPFRALVQQKYQCVFNRTVIVHQFPSTQTLQMLLFCGLFPTNVFLKKPFRYIFKILTVELFSCVTHINVYIWCSCLLFWLWCFLFYIPGALNFYLLYCV